jgi:acyl-CoA thioester hydrolase
MTMNPLFQKGADPQRTLPYYHTTVKAEWIDSNNHMAVPYYHVIMNDAAWHAAESWDYGVGYHTRTQRTSFILEMHLNYLRELMLGDPVVATVRIAGLDEKRMVLYYEVYNERDNYLAATGEALGISVDMATRRVIPFEAALHQRLKAAHDVHRAMEPPPQTSILRIGPAGLEKAVLP